MGIFAIYELIQIKIEGSEYFKDFWNYFEMAGITLFYWAMYIDITNEHLHDDLRILWIISLQLCLVKLVYLVRVFKQLNFLVTMLITVVNEISYFMLLFLIFCIIYAECQHILHIDVSFYGRTPNLLGHFVNTIRGSVGDFAMIDMF